VHLYLHIPFCARRCSYCDFAISVRSRIPAREYVDAVKKEIELLGGLAKSSASLSSAPVLAPVSGTSKRISGSHPRSALPAAPTLYLGGGTPSLLPTDALAELVTFLLEAFPRRSSSTPSRDAVEVTLEANPEDVTPENAASWRQMGVNRISLGAQSFDDRVLQWMHRVHNAERIPAAMSVLRTAGFDNVSIDLIFALPEELKRDWERDLSAIIALEPEHISLYGLTVETRTPLARWITRGASSAPDEDRYAFEYITAHKRLTAAGYRFYEVSNAAKGDRTSRHNSAYWSGEPYLGLGPAAHSFDGRSRHWNLSAWEAYRAALGNGQSPIESREVLTPAQQELERVYLSLRTSEGLDLRAAEHKSPAIAKWVTEGWAAITGDRLHLTAEGWLRLDALVRDLTGATPIL
jgi:oxygen-independent coproporphyrinogen III oxidase